MWYSSTLSERNSMLEWSSKGLSLFFLFKIFPCGFFNMYWEQVASAHWSRWFPQISLTLFTLSTHQVFQSIDHDLAGFGTSVKDNILSTLDWRRIFMCLRKNAFFTFSTTFGSRALRARRVACLLGVLETDIHTTRICMTHTTHDSNHTDTRKYTQKLNPGD